TLVNTMDNTTLDVAGVVAKFGVPPERITDYLALVGDTSDNIPGVRGVGAKTAARWLEQYGSLDELVTHAEEVRGKVGERLRDALGELDLYRQLATIDRDCKLPVEVTDLTVQPAREDELRELFQRLELTSLLKRRLPQPVAGTEPAPAPDTVERRYDTVLTGRQLDEWIDAAKAAGIVALNTVTAGGDYMESELVGISLATEPGRAAY